jgi:bacteriocin-like protein
VTIKVLEETPRTLYLVMPVPVTISAARELTEKELETVAGGKEADDAWSKVKGMFGDDGGLADTTEGIGKVGAE